MLHIDGVARFVSDLHLRQERPEIAARFGRFLADTAQQKIAALFILGDLFEYWIGDDDLGDPFNAATCAQLRGLSDQGTRVFFIAGNRDFLIGRHFADACGIQLLADAQKVGIGDTALLLLHGDTLCTDDLPYQQFRTMVRSTAWQHEFLGRPLDARRAEVASLRRRSAEAMQGKTAAIMDVNATAVRHVLQNAACQHLIHGHTHRPGHEEITLPAQSLHRWVLSDWDTGRGDALEVGPHGINRLDLSQ